MFQRQGGQRNIIENSGEKTEPENGFPRGSGQFFHWHHRRTENESEQEDRSLEGGGQHFPIRPARRQGEEDGNPNREANKRKAIGHRGEFHIYRQVRREREEENKTDDTDPHPIHRRPLLTRPQNG